MPCKPCCCVASRNGAIAIGILQIVTCGMGMVNIFQAFDAISDIQALPNNSKRRNNGIQKWSRKHPGFGESDPETFFTILYVILSFWVIMMVLNIIFGSLLIYAIIKKCAPLIQAHLIFTIIHLVLLFLLQLLNLNPLSVTVESDTEVLYYFTLYLVRFYLIYVVYCSYLETQEMQMHRPYGPAEMFAVPQPLVGQAGAFYYTPSPQPGQQALVAVGQGGGMYYPPHSFQQQLSPSVGQAGAYYPPQQSQQTLMGQGYPTHSHLQPQGPSYPIYTQSSISQPGQCQSYPYRQYPMQSQLNGHVGNSYPSVSVSYTPSLGAQVVQYNPYAI